ncbi:hypothetical protein PR048_013268 [Dryococelus australis]|uniref:Peptidase A2 domain-containing protein n=1 Tax=Dryococelus australis TaxID=614101 RepID=A0ABQ9HRN6_9NEOP|nr:hypothetical protein PR048_013268 [Dryococelus australis]
MENREHRVQIHLNQKSKTVNFKLDTGSEVNIIQQCIVRQVANTSQLNKPNIILEGFGGYRVRPIGVIKSMCSINKADSGHKWLQFFVVQDGSCRMPILGLPGCICLNMYSSYFVYSINKGDLREDIFIYVPGIGFIANKSSLIVDKSVQPVAKPPRRVPL